MSELDAIYLSLVIFIPTLFALLVLLIPRGYEEAMRWVSLIGTALTLGVSLFICIQYRSDVLDFHGVFFDEANRPNASLAARAAEMDNAAPGAVHSSQDWVARYPWIPRFNINYFVGVDGISLPLVLLTTVLSFLAMIASWRIDRFVKGYCALFLVLETGMIGTFLGLDFFLFYIFWEVMLLPMYFLIGIWGGPRREYAAIKFFLYTLLGSVFILIALLGFYFTDVSDFVSPERRAAEVTRLKKEHPEWSDAELEKSASVNTFDLILLQRVGKAAQEYLNYQKESPTGGKRLADVLTTVPALQKPKQELEAARKANDQAAITRAEADLKTAEAGVASRLDQAFFKPWFQYTMFLFLFIGFAIKVPVFPFHTWLPDAHVEAPTPISMILAGVLLKMGGYGIIRIAYPICPWAAEQWAWWVALCGVINIVYGAFAAMAQTDFKKLVAYSSVSHMGYVILGIAVWSAPEKAAYWSWGMNGAMFQMIAHGITSAGMFFLVGVIYDRAHHRNLDNFRGLYEPMPLYGGISAIIFFAAMGLPGMCGFVGEFMVVLATWNFSKLFAVLAALTVVLTAAYILWTLQRVFMGTNPAYKNYSDIDVRELVCIIPLVILAVLFGVFPDLLLKGMGMEPSVTGLVDKLAVMKTWLP
jgi:NADH-quinone oxidoreductase subunit M